MINFVSLVRPEMPSGSKHNLLWDRDFQPFPSHDTSKLNTTILWHAEKVYFFADLTNIGII